MALALVYDLELYHTSKKKTDTVYHRLVEAMNSRHRSLTKEIVFALASYVQQSSQDSSTRTNKGGT
jgi:hypothetical protein